MENSEQLKILTEFVCNYHFPITGINRHSKKQETIGTCTLLNIDGRIFLVTASHVMNERHNVEGNELWLWNYSDGSKITITEDIIGNPGPDVPHWNDVAVVELNISEYSTFNNKNFFDSCFLNPNHIAHELHQKSTNKNEVHCLIAGYPSSKNKTLKNENKKPKQFQYLTKLIEADPDLNTELLTVSLSWDNSDVSESGCSLPKPQGISGGGIWIFPEDSEFSPKLFAVAVAHIKSEKKLSASKWPLY